MSTKPGAITKPVASITLAAELVPSNLLSTLVSDEDVANGFRLDALSLDVENLWTDAYSRIRAG